MKIITKNKKADFNYFVEDRLEAGVVLEGWEVKSILLGKVNFQESYVRVINEEVFLVGCSITPPVFVSTHNIIDKTRSKKLLLNKREIQKIIGKVSRSGYTLVPIDIHLNNGKIKIQIGLAKGKKLHDKREDQKIKTADRELRQQSKSTQRE